MSKYDCTKARDYLHELKRASEWCRGKGLCDCRDCEMHSKNGLCFVSVSQDISKIPEDKFDFVIEKIQKWSDSHPERRKLTEDEMHILKAFKALGYKYITVDKGGTVCIYTVPPKKGGTVWYNNTTYEQAMGAVICKVNEFFGGILYFDDEEPAEIEELLKGYE